MTDDGIMIMIDQHQNCTVFYNILYNILLQYTLQYNKTLEVSREEFAFFMIFINATVFFSINSATRAEQVENK